MNVQYRIHQILNMFSKMTDQHKLLNWVFIYGLPRSGTSFMLQQFMRVSRRGIGDWELKEFIMLIEHIGARDYVALDTGRLILDLRNKIMDTAFVGGGSRFDITVKQIATNADELELYCKMFGPPQRKIFMFREPDGFLPSAMKKFGIDESEALSLYKNALGTYDAIGGEILEYGQDIVHFLDTETVFQNIRTDAFAPRRIDAARAPEAFHTAYEAFKSSHTGSESQ